MTTEEENKMTTRSSRESENHDKSTRQTHWTPRRQLEAPPDRPGFRYRWIRESMLGSEDRSNVSRRLREGFRLVRAEDLPEEWRDYMDCVDEGRHSGVIFNQGLLLAEIPENMLKSELLITKVKLKMRMTRLTILCLMRLAETIVMSSMIQKDPLK